MGTTRKLEVDVDLLQRNEISSIEDVLDAAADSAAGIVGAEACRLLGSMGGSPKARTALLAGLRNARRAVHYWEAAKSLGFIGRPVDIRKVEILVADAKETDRAAAGLYCLSMLGPRASRPISRFAIPSLAPRIRAAAVEALGVLAARKYRGQIERMLVSDRSARVRVACAYALGRLGGRKSAGMLRQLLTSTRNGKKSRPSLELRRTVAVALRELAGSERKSP